MLLLSRPKLKRIFSSFREAVSWAVVGERWARKVRRPGQVQSVTRQPGPGKGPVDVETTPTYAHAIGSAVSASNVALGAAPAEAILQTYTLEHAEVDHVGFARKRLAAVHPIGRKLVRARTWLFECGRKCRIS
jgi:hypothetical protein